MRYEFRIPAAPRPIQVRVDAGSLEEGLSQACRAQELIRILLGQERQGAPKLVLSPLREG